MSQSVLNLHSGGHLVTYDELRAVPVPEATRTWHPVPHHHVLDTVLETLKGAGYEVRDQKLAVARENGTRFFGTLDLATPLTHGVALSVGIRNSTDKSFPLGFCAGSRVFVCSNLSFSAELLVKRKHSRFGAMRFQNAIAGSVKALGTFKDAEQARLERLMTTEVTDDQALAFLVRAMERGIIAAPTIPKVLAEWRKPTHDYGTGERPTLWLLANCFTTVLGKKAVTRPSEYAGQTIRLNALLQPRIAVAEEVKDGPVVSA